MFTSILSIFAVIAAIALLLLVFFAFWKSIVIVPQRHEYVIERLGKYRRTLEADFMF